MNIIPIEFATPEYDETIALRDKILRKPLGLSFTEAQLAQEFSDFHIAAYDEAWVLRGCLVLTPKSETVIKMRQVAVDAALQKRGTGTALVHYSEAFAKAKGYTVMELNARDTAVPFYERLGYSIEGDMFEEVTIPHYKMVKSMEN